MTGDLPAAGFYSQNCRDGKHPTPDGPPPCTGCDCPCHADNPTRPSRWSDILPDLGADG